MKENVDSVAPSADLRSAPQISEWLASQVAKTLKIERSAVDIDARFERYSLDSLLLVVMMEELEKWLGTPVDPTSPFDHPTIRALAEHLAQQKRGSSLDDGSSTGY
ncbi:MAG: acyl carrier protein [Acidobacteriota bacterium]